MPDPRLAPALAVLLLAPGPLWADDVVWPARPVLPSAAWQAPDEAASAPRAHRIRPFGFQAGFLSNPVGLEDDPPAGPDAPAGVDDIDWARVAMGSYNPFFDVRRPGDLGGVGYFRLHSQMQLVDTDSTGFTLALQALTPAGRDFDGVEGGPTVVTPALGVYQALDDDGTALHGFVGKTVPGALRQGGPLHRGVECGVAVQTPLLPQGPTPDNVYLVVGTLGRYRLTEAAGPAASWDVLPGMHWQMGPNGFLAGSLVLPLNGGPPLRLDGGGWQLTFALQF